MMICRWQRARSRLHCACKLTYRRGAYVLRHCCLTQTSDSVPVCSLCWSRIQLVTRCAGNPLCPGQTKGAFSLQWYVCVPSSDSSWTGGVEGMRRPHSQDRCSGMPPAPTSTAMSHFPYISDSFPRPCIYRNDYIYRNDSFGRFLIIQWRQDGCAHFGT
jgi:hypothetical protein